MDWLSPIWLSLQLATLVTLILLALGTPLAWWLARTRSWWKVPLSAIIAMPLVLPPTVLGFYLLIAFAPQAWLGGLMQRLGLGSLVFTFTGLVVASVLYSLPFAVQPLQNAFAAIDARTFEVGATLRAGAFDRFLHIALPLARPGFVSAAVLTFAHTIGEFGVVLMIGGNIPDKTRVLSIAIYDHVEALEYTQAHWLAGGLVIFAFLVLAVLYAVNKSTRAMR